MHTLSYLRLLHKCIVPKRTFTLNKPLLQQEIGVQNQNLVTRVSSIHFHNIFQPLRHGTN